VHFQHAFQGAYALAIVFRVVYWTMACLLMVLGFQVMYYYCPDVQNRKWRWFTPGGLIGLGGWIAGSIALRIYLHYFNSYSATYGTLGAVIILLLWFYVTGISLLLGAEVNSEIEHAAAQHGDQDAKDRGEVAPGEAKPREGLVQPTHPEMQEKLKEKRPAA